MTTATRSAFPASVDDLMPAARDLVSELGPLFSRNKLMKRLHIGDEKANEILDRLQKEQAAALEPGESGGEDRAGPEADAKPEVAGDAAPDVATRAEPARIVKPWPVILLALPAMVAIWTGWVGLGGLTGFGPVHPLPGTPWKDLVIDSAITLPVGMEAYAAYALRVWLSPGLPVRARTFARWSAIGSLSLGAAGQVAYHLMVAAGMTHAPWQITTLVSCLPVAVLGMGAALYHLASSREEQ